MAVLALGLALGLAGCGSQLATPELPPLKSDRTFLTPEQQAKAMSELAAKKDAEQAEALRQIEKTR